MLADAADSSLAFTRILDNEDLDPATSSDHIDVYQKQMKALFFDRKVLHVLDIRRQCCKS